MQYAAKPLDSDLSESITSGPPIENDKYEEDFLEAVFGTQSTNLRSNPDSEVEINLEEPVEGRKVGMS